MTMKIRRILSVFLLSVLLTGLFAVVPAYALNDPAIQSRAALLVDADTGKVLYEKNGFTEQYPASITKVMVALLVLEAVERGELKLSQEITATESSLANLTEDSSTADIVAGETMTVEDLLYCMMLVSANEAGDIFGEAIYGSSQAMVDARPSTRKLAPLDPIVSVPESSGAAAERCRRALLGSSETSARLTPSNSTVM